MDEIKNISKAMPHGITMRERKNMTVTGVSEIVSFDESCVILDVADCRLSIEGSGLKIESFSNDSGDVQITGLIDSVIYSGKTQTQYRRGFFKRIFSYDE